jgi:hypothetical protein
MISYEILDIEDLTYSQEDDILNYILGFNPLKPLGDNPRKLIVFVNKHLNKKWIKIALWKNVKSHENIESLDYVFHNNELVRGVDENKN